MKKVTHLTIIFLFILSLLPLASCTYDLSGEATRGNRLLPAYQEKCFDSDEGINLEEKGITKGLMLQRDGTKKPTVKTDNCKDNKVIEYYCDRNLVKSTIKSCSNGEVCEDSRQNDRPMWLLLKSLIFRSTEKEANAMDTR